MISKVSIAAALAATMLLLTVSTADAAIISVASDAGGAPSFADSGQMGEAPGESPVRSFNALNARWDGRPMSVDRLFSRYAASEQALSVFLGAVLNDAPPLRLNFITDAGITEGRTAQTPAAQGNDAPLPLFLAGIAGLGFAGRRKMDAVRAA